MPRHVTVPSWSVGLSETPTLGNSTAVGPIVFKFEVFRDFYKVRGGVHLHVLKCTPIFHISNSWTDCVQMLCVARSQLDKSFAQIRWVHLHVWKCTPLSNDSASAVARSSPITGLIGVNEMTVLHWAHLAPYHLRRTQRNVSFIDSNIYFLCISVISFWQDVCYRGLQRWDGHHLHNMVGGGRRGRMSLATREHGSCCKAGTAAPSARQAELATLQNPCARKSWYLIYNYFS